MLNIEARTKELLVRKNMTIQKLAVLSEISEPTVHSIFKKNDAKLSQLEAICQVLEVPITYLLGIDSNYVATEPISPPQGLNKKDVDLQLCQEKVKGLEMLIKAKDETIALLKGRFDSQA
jgi:DNA-binding Xre family transcriptional regulator